MRWRGGREGEEERKGGLGRGGEEGMKGRQEVLQVRLLVLINNKGEIRCFSLSPEGVMRERGTGARRMEEKKREKDRRKKKERERVVDSVYFSLYFCVFSLPHFLTSFPFPFPRILEFFPKICIRVF